MAFSQRARTPPFTRPGCRSSGIANVAMPAARQASPVRRPSPNRQDWRRRLDEVAPVARPDLSFAGEPEREPSSPPRSVLGHKPKTMEMPSSSLARQALAAVNRRAGSTRGGICRQPSPRKQPVDMGTPKSPRSRIMSARQQSPRTLVEHRPDFGLASTAPLTMIAEKLDKDPVEDQENGGNVSEAGVDAADDRSFSVVEDENRIALSPIQPQDGQNVSVEQSEEFATVAGDDAHCQFRAPSILFSPSTEKQAILHDSEQLVEDLEQLAEKTLRLDTTSDELAEKTLRLGTSSDMDHPLHASSVLCSARGDEAHACCAPDRTPRTSFSAEDMDDADELLLKSQQLLREISSLVLGSDEDEGSQLDRCESPAHESFRDDKGISPRGSPVVNDKRLSELVPEKCECLDELQDMTEQSKAISGPPANMLQIPLDVAVELTNHLRVLEGMLTTSARHSWCPDEEDLADVASSRRCDFSPQQALELCQQAHALSQRIQRPAQCVRAIARTACVASAASSPYSGIAAAPQVGITSCTRTACGASGASSPKSGTTPVPGPDVGIVQGLHLTAPPTCPTRLPAVDVQTVAGPTAQGATAMLGPAVLKGPSPGPFVAKVPRHPIVVRQVWQQTPQPGTQVQPSPQPVSSGMQAQPSPQPVSSGMQVQTRAQLVPGSTFRQASPCHSPPHQQARSQQHDLF